MRTGLLLWLVAAAVIVVWSCNNSGTKQTGSKQEQAAAKDTAAPSCSTEPIQDPNDPKPMALMMRQMAANADSMKAQVMRGQLLDPGRYPFIRFYLAEPTDPSVLEPAFYENARLFQEAYKAIFAMPRQQERYYNLMIGKCVSCHEHYCSGPLKRIRKLFTNPGQNGVY